MQQNFLFHFACSLLFFFGTAEITLGQSLELTDSLGIYYIHSDFPIQELYSKTTILKKNAATTSIVDIIQKNLKPEFKPLTDSAISDSRSVWLHIPIFSNIDLPDHQLIFKRQTDRNKYVTTHDSISMYVVKNDKLVASERTGAYVPASEKAIKFPITVDRFSISFKKDEQIDLYFKLHDKVEILPTLELRNPSFEVYLPPDNQIKTLTSFALILAVYVFCFYFFTKDRSYLFLFGLFFNLVLHYQLLTNTIWPVSVFFPENPNWINIVWIFTTTMNGIFLLLFAREFTSLKTKLPTWDKVLRFILLYFCFGFLLRLTFWKFNSLIYPMVENITAGIGFLAILVLVIRLAFYKDRLIRYFVFAASWLVFWNTLGILWQAGILPFWQVPNPWVIAQGGFMLILAVAIARKLQLSERARSEVEKVREIASIKSRFFANISHEFRTPLSLILGPITQSMENIPSSDQIEDTTEVPVKGKHLKVMRRNAMRLQQLVDQILDLSKLDQGKMKLRVVERDIVQFIRALVMSFESLAELKHIEFNSRFPKRIENSYFDPDKLEKILINLLSNAFKFTPEHGEITVNIEDNGTQLKIAVSDSGEGIKPSELDKIFDRFYQTEGSHDQGTGIGLALVKELVELHKGKISVSSTEEQGTTFKLIIPYKRSDFTTDEIADETDLETIESRAYDFVSEISSHQHKPDYTNQELPLALIVEDNPELRDYIAEQLCNTFGIQFAENGKVGLKKALSHLPDIIISDVMMPKMNGIELCNALKADIKTSHIPIILLTAKAGQKAKLDGLETGADAYLTKPFDSRELLIRAQNIIAQRALIREKYTGELKVEASKVNLTSMDERFVKQLMLEIEDNIGNEFYAVEDLASALGFSRSQLNRKLKAILDRSPNQLIREFRLGKAKEMLVQKTASVSEVAFSVGYSNLSYFSKSFKEAFGKLPSEV